MLLFDPLQTIVEDTHCFFSSTYNMYRSFVTCDDPNGVIECGTITRSKKTKMKWRSNSNSSHRPSSLQLMEVSEGAQKLNQVINSWSKGEKHEKDSKNLAKDLLQGALDLQESLVMLGNLQQASKHISKLKEKRKSEISRVDSTSLRFQNPRLSADGDSIEELKKVIRESLAMHNLLNERNNEENFDSGSDMPSTSSSQSSVIRISNFSSTDSLISSAASTNKAKGPNLIAKLMGLEEIPSKAMQISPSHQRSVFDIDMPRTRKNPKRRTLQEILETAHSFKESDSHSHHFHDSFPGQKHPIVLIKPLHLSWSQGEAEKTSTPVFGEEKAPRKETVLLKKPKVKEEVHRKKRVADNTPTKKTKEMFSYKMKSCGSITQQQEKKVGVGKNSVKVETKVAKPVDEETVKAKTVSKYQQEAKVTPVKTHNARKQGSALSSISTSKSRAVVSSTNVRKKSSSVKKEKPNRNLKPSKENTENSGHKGDDKRINLNSENDPSIIAIDQSSMNERKEYSENQIGDDCDSDQNSVFEIMTLVAESKEDAKSSEEVDDPLSPRETTTKSTLKALLLSNLEFLHNAKEHFDLDVNVPTTTSEIHRTIDASDAETRLFLDCANEIIQSRGCSDSQLVNFLLTKVFRFIRMHVSIDQLLDEVCHGVDTLRSYSELAGKSNTADNIQLALEGDIWRHKEMMPNGIWGLGWRHGFSMDDMENIVYDLETQILTSLVEEIF